MYKIKKQKKRTSKEIFAILKDKLIEWARSQPRARTIEPTVQNILFPQPISFSQPKDEEFSEPAVSLDHLKKNPHAKYPFYLQKCIMKIPDEVIKPLEPHTLVKMHRALKLGKPNCLTSNGQNLLVLGTEAGYVVVGKNLNSPEKYFIQHSKQPIVSISATYSYIAVCNSSGLHTLYQFLNNQLKILHEWPSTVSLSMQLLQDGDSFLLFTTDLQGGFNRIRLRKWMLMWKVDIKQLLKQKYFFTAIKILDRQIQKQFFKDSHKDKLIIAIGNFRIVHILAYNQSCTTWIDKLYSNSNLVGANEKGTAALEFIVGPTFKETEPRLLLCCAFDDKIFHISIDNSTTEIALDNCNSLKTRIDFTISKRLRCPNSIVSICFVGRGLYLLTTKTGSIFYCHTSNCVVMKRYSTLTELKKIQLHYNQDMKHLHTAEYVPALKGHFLYGHSVCMMSGFLFLLTQKEFAMVEVLTSLGLQRRMAMTQNIYLLQYLILLKRCQSKYLTKPDNFADLELSFPRESMENKQILLQYYYLMGTEPPEDLATPDELCQLLLPFIMQHHLSNISDEQAEQLVNYWQSRQPHLIEQIIMSGINKGWEVAIKHAWMRSLIKMVQMGAQYDFPLLKLYGYVVTYRESNPELMKKYAEQILQYILLGLSKKLKSNVVASEYAAMVQLFVKILFEKDLFDVLVSVKPKKVVSMLTQLFTGSSHQIIDDIELSMFIIGCNRRYPHIVISSGSISEILYSHACQTILEQFPTDPVIEECLILQQAQLFHDFQFKLTEERAFKIIITLLSNLQLYDRLKSRPIFEGKHRQELQLATQKYILELIGCLADTYCLKEEQRWSIIELADKSSSFDYVAIELLSQTKKFESVFAKYLNCRNPIIREMIFDWMSSTMDSLKLDHDPKHLQEFNRVSLSKVRFYMQINKQKTKDFVQKYYKNNEKKLISKIEQYPQLQLEYVELIIKDSQDQQIEEYILNLHMQLLCRLAPSRIIPVLEEYSTHDKIKYNLKEVLDMCNEWKHTEAVIYINQKMGEVFMSLQRHLEVFYEEWEKYKRDKRSNSKEEQQQQQARRTVSLAEFRSLLRKQASTVAKNDDEEKDSEAVLYDHLDYILDIIHRQPKLPSYYELYDLLVNGFMRVYQLEEEQARSVVNKGDDSFLNKISDLVGVLILDLAKQGNIDYLIDQVITKYVHMDFREMRKHFYRTYKFLHESLTMMKNVSEVSKTYLIDFNLNTRANMIKSVHSDFHCGLCKSVLAEDSQLLLFNCGHIYHMDCSVSQDESDYCEECVCGNPIEAMIDDPELNLSQYIRDRQSKLSQQKKEEKQLAQGEKEVKTMSMKQKRLNKMKLFDKRQQELVIETETIELRLELRETIE